MIRVVTLDSFDRPQVDKLVRIIYQAFGLGCEYVGDVTPPREAVRGDALDSGVLLSRAPDLKSLANDKILFLTSRPLAPRELPSGTAPTPGFAEQGGVHAVISTHGLPAGDALLKRIAKQAIHDLGHLWELHHCLDPRCSMHPPWTPTFQTGEPVLCTFCREKSEQRIRLSTA